eukprot:SAG11_NODE_223_length_12120_cov_6.351884_8_plen_178_part_00
MFPESLIFADCCSVRPTFLWFRGAAFYVDHTTKRTQWDLPPELEAALGVVTVDDDGHAAGPSARVMLEGQQQLEEAQAADGATVPFIAILGWNKMIPKSNQLRAAFEAVSDGWGDLDPRLRFAVVERSRTADLGVKLWSAAQGTTVSCEKGRRTAPQMREWLERSIEMQTIGAAARV